MMRIMPNYLFIDFAEALDRHPELKLGIYVHFWFAAQVIAEKALELGCDADEIMELLPEIE